MKQNKNASFPKIHVLTRPDVNVALVILKKSNKATGFFELNFSNHIIREGQWIAAKVYERRCDLSEDGKHIIYFAAKFYKNKNPRIWTALSKFPYFKALDFYDKGNTYNGGGIFLSKNEYLLNETYAQTELYKKSSFKVTRGKLNNVLLDDETEGIYYPRLIRDGWKDEGAVDDTRFFKKVYKNYEIEKACCINASGVENRSIFYDINTFKINGEIKLEIESDWMDFKNEKLYWTDKGKIFYAHLKTIEDVKLIADLNDYQYKPIIVKYD